MVYIVGLWLGLSVVNVAMLTRMLGDDVALTVPVVVLSIAVAGVIVFGSDRWATRQ